MVIRVSFDGGASRDIPVTSLHTVAVEDEVGQRVDTLAVQGLAGLELVLTDDGEVPVDGSQELAEIAARARRLPPVDVSDPGEDVVARAGFGAFVGEDDGVVDADAVDSPEELEAHADAVDADEREAPYGYRADGSPKRGPGGRPRKELAA